jgi:fatty acid desaturase
MEADTTIGPSSIPRDELRQLQQRSDGKGLLRLAGHLAAIAGTGWLYAACLQRSAHWTLVAAAATAYGFTLVTMFAAMHECVHRTAFRNQGLNDSIGWFAGLLSFYNSTFYRHYHGWHHRFTQLPGKDPELDDPKPTSLPSYLVEMSGVPWWIGKVRTHLRLARGQFRDYPYLTEKTGPPVVRSVRLQLLAYAVAIAASVASGQALFLTWWLLPVAAAQPLLRAILLAEHGGCSEDDNPFTNTRTTHTIFAVRYLMWQMPYHAEHHRHPALPFFSLAPAHQVLGPHFAHVARRGYLGVHRELLGRLLEGSPPGLSRDKGGF